MHDAALDSSEKGIIEALERGDRRAALDMMMDVYGATLYRFCQRMVRDDALADDAHQQTFIQAFESLDRFEGRSSVKTWLYSIARHRCLDIVKVRGRRWSRFLPMPEARELAAGSPGLEERLHESSRRSRLRECLGKLQAKVRAAVLLRYQENLSYAQMSEVCGERAPTLQARVARSLPVLRRCLEHHGEVW